MHNFHRDFILLLSLNIKFLDNILFVEIKVCKCTYLSNLLIKASVGGNSLTICCQSGIPCQVEIQVRGMRLNRMENIPS